MKTTDKSTELSEDLLIKKGLSKYGKRAYNASLVDVNEVSVIYGNNIIKIDSEGSKVNVASVGQVKSKVKQRRFKLIK